MKDSRLLDDISTVIVLILVRYLAVIAFFESSTTNLATVEAVSLDIYCDSLCTRVANSIDWGSLRLDHQTVPMYDGYSPHRIHDLCLTSGKHRSADSVGSSQTDLAFKDV